MGPPRWLARRLPNSTSLIFTRIRKAARCGKDYPIFAGVPVENLLAGAGADELIDLLLRVLLEPDDCVINCPPTFGMYPFDTLLNAGQVIEIPRRQADDAVFHSIWGHPGSCRNPETKVDFHHHPQQPGRQSGSAR